MPETASRLGDPVPSKNRGKCELREAAGTSREVGVNLKEGYNGDLTSREAGSVGGQMVKKMCPVQTAQYTRTNRTAPGHETAVRYIASITV